MDMTFTQCLPDGHCTTHICTQDPEKLLKFRGICTCYETLIIARRTGNVTAYTTTTLGKCPFIWGWNKRSLTPRKKRRLYCHVFYPADGDRYIFCKNGTFGQTTLGHIHKTVILLLISVRKHSNSKQIYLQRGSEKNIWIWDKGRQRWAGENKAMSN